MRRPARRGCSGLRAPIPPAYGSTPWPRGNGASPNRSASCASSWAEECIRSRSKDWTGRCESWCGERNAHHGIERDSSRFPSAVVSPCGRASRQGRVSAYPGIDGSVATCAAGFRSRAAPERRIVGDPWRSHIPGRVRRSARCRRAAGPRSGHAGGVQGGTRWRRGPVGPRRRWECARLAGRRTGRRPGSARDPVARRIVGAGRADVRRKAEGLTGRRRRRWSGAAGDRGSGRRGSTPAGASGAGARCTGSAACSAGRSGAAGSTGAAARSAALGPCQRGARDDHRGSQRARNRLPASHGLSPFQTGRRPTHGFCIRSGVGESTMAAPASGPRNGRIRNDQKR